VSEWVSEYKASTVLHSIITYMDFKKNWIKARSHAKKNTASKKSYQTTYWKNPFEECKMFESIPYVYNAKKILTDFRTIITDQTRRARFEQIELENRVLKSILRAQCLPGAGKQYAKRKLFHARRLSHYEHKRSILKNLVKPRGTITRVRNRCVISGRSSIVGSSGLSRISFRRLAGIGKIPGLLKQ